MGLPVADSVEKLQKAYDVQVFARVCNGRGLQSVKSSQVHHSLNHSLRKLRSLAYAHASKLRHQAI